MTTKRALPVTLLLLILLIIPAQLVAAGWNPFEEIGDFFQQNVIDPFKEELERSSLGREILRIVDDLENVIEIAQVVSQLSSPVGIAQFASEYGHDPVRAFDRYIDRLDVFRLEQHSPIHQNIRSINEELKGYETSGSINVGDFKANLQVTINTVDPSDPNRQELINFKGWLDQRQDISSSDRQAFDQYVQNTRTTVTQVGLSDEEVAAALQSVLEEPVLPDDVYLGDTCIIDFSGCAYDTYSDQPLERPYWWAHSCYVEGIVSKKKIAGRNQATCQATWVTHNPQTHDFFYDTTHATYDWQRCPRVHLTQTEQDNFINNRGTTCQFPIARHDVGDPCVVDMSQCSYAAYGRMNHGRVGTIVYGELRFRGRRNVHSCDVIHGNFGLTPAVRANPFVQQQCITTVAVGNREVREFLTANPEPTPTPTPTPQVSPTPTPSPTPSPSPYEALPVPPGGLTVPQLPAGISPDSDFVQRYITRLGDAGQGVVASQVAFSRDGVSSFEDTFDSRRQDTAVFLANFGVQNTLQADLGEAARRLTGQEIPGYAAAIFGDDNVELNVYPDFGSNPKWCLVLSGGVVQSFTPCSDSFTADVIVETSEQTFYQIRDGHKTIQEALDDESVTYQGVALGATIRYGIASFLAGFLG